MIHNVRSHLSLIGRGPPFASIITALPPPVKRISKIIFKTLKICLTDSKKLIAYRGRNLSVSHKKGGLTQ